jgi:hypothetical protein
MMNRREALRILATGATLPLAPGKMLAVMREARAVMGQQGAPASRTLDAHQTATVAAMAEMILPKTETPGAADVGASDFIDLILTEWYEDAERTRFLNGLAEVDARSKALFGKDFVACTPLQQGAILTELGEEMIEEVEPQQDQSVATGGLATAGSENFYSRLRWLTLTAYYTSEAGATEELHYQIIPDRHDECAEITVNQTMLNESMLNPKLR